jgi:chromosome segregation ATPase
MAEEKSGLQAKIEMLRDENSALEQHLQSLTHDSKMKLQESIENNECLKIQISKLEAEKLKLSKDLTVTIAELEKLSIHVQGLEIVSTKYYTLLQKQESDTSKACASKEPERSKLESTYQEVEKVDQGMDSLDEIKSLRQEIE